MTALAPPEGFPGLCWQLHAEERTDMPLLLLCLHGAGASAAVWAPLAAALGETTPAVHLDMFCLDLPAHGLHAASDGDDDQLLAMESIKKDVLARLRLLHGDAMSTPRDIMLLGHSLGGAVAVHVAAALVLDPDAAFRPVGIVLLDVAEATATAALPHLRTALRSRPRCMPSLDAAAAWLVDQRLVGSCEAALASLPRAMERLPRGEYRWRPDLLRAEQHWEAWFAGCDEAFLALPMRKMLIVSSVDVLDSELTVAQMQGRIQVAILPNVTHGLHEDNPRAVAILLARFLERTAPQTVPETA